MNNDRAKDYTDEEIRAVKNLDQKIKLLISKAIKDGKISGELAQNLKKVAVDNYDTVDKIISSIRPGHVFLLEIEHLEYDELFKKGNSLEIIKKYLPDRFKEIYFKKFGKYPKS